MPLKVTIVLVILPPLQHSLFESLSSLNSIGTCFISWFLPLVVYIKLEGCLFGDGMEYCFVHNKIDSIGYNYL